MAVDLVQLAWAMVASLALIAGVIVIIHFIYTFGGRKGPKDFFLLRVLLDKNNHASLSAFQFLCWTLLIAFLYLTLWFLHSNSCSYSSGVMLLRAFSNSSGSRTFV